MVYVVCLYVLYCATPTPHPTMHGEREGYVRTKQAHLPYVVAYVRRTCVQADVVVLYICLSPS